MPSKMRNTSSLALKLLEERGTVWLFDCGEAAQHQILHTSVKLRKIEKIFITHMHGDHIFGLPGLLGSRSFLGGDEAIDIYGPPGLQEYVETVLRLSRTHLTYGINFYEQREGILFEDELMTVETAQLEHAIPSWGYRITQKPLPPKLLIEKATALGVPKGPLLAKLKSGEDVSLDDGTVVKSSDVTEAGQDGFAVTILGDTRFSEAAIRLSQHADVVVHEATFDAETQKLATEYGHSTFRDAARTASLAGAGTVIFNHISARFLPEDEKRLLAQVQGVHPRAFIARDLMEFDWHHQTRELKKK